MKLEKFDQIGIVVKNIENASKYLGLLLDFKGKINIVDQKNIVFYKGKEATFRMKKIMQNFGGVQFEVIQLLESTGNHLYKEFLEKGHQGLHHIGIYTKEANTLEDYFKREYNIDVIQTGKYGKVKFDYLDTKDTLGFYIELISF
jgi:hypothetical protein